MPIAASTIVTIRAGLSATTATRAIVMEFIQLLLLCLGESGVLLFIVISVSDIGSIVSSSTTNLVEL